jgi:hypothetical protein
VVSFTKASQKGSQNDLFRDLINDILTSMIERDLKLNDYRSEITNNDLQVS